MQYKGIKKLIFLCPDVTSGIDSCKSPHMSRVTCQMSLVTCHVSCVTIFLHLIFNKNKKLVYTVLDLVVRGSGIKRGLLCLSLLTLSSSQCHFSLSSVIQYHSSTIPFFHLTFHSLSFSISLLILSIFSDTLFAHPSSPADSSLSPVVPYHFYCFLLLLSRSLLTSLSSSHFSPSSSNFLLS